MDAVPTPAPAPARGVASPTRWGLRRVAAWGLVLAWSAALIATGITGMLTKAFL